MSAYTWGTTASSKELDYADLFYHHASWYDGALMISSILELGRLTIRNHAIIQMTAVDEQTT